MMEIRTVFQHLDPGPIMNRLHGARLAAGFAATASASWLLFYALQIVQKSLDIHQEGAIYFLVFAWCALAIAAGRMWRRAMRRYRDFIGKRLRDRQRNAEKFTEKDSEKVDWLNYVLQRCWLMHQETIATGIREGINAALAAHGLPLWLADCISISEFSLGDNAPQVASVKSYPAAKEGVIRLDMELLHQPILAGDDDPSADTRSRSKDALRSRTRNSKITLSLKTPFGFDLPIVTVDAVAFAATVGVQISTMSTFPYIDTVSVCLTKCPDMAFKLRLMNTVDIMAVVN